MVQINQGLKPCPFCGGDATIHDYRTAPAGAWVLIHRAKNCLLAPKIESFPSEEAAIAAWNRRTPSPNPQDER